MTVVEISVSRLKNEEKHLMEFLNKNKEKLISSARKLLIVKTNMKFGLGVNATFEDSATHTVVTNTISTKHITRNSLVEVSKVVDSLISDFLDRFEHINTKGSGHTVKKITMSF